MVFFLNNLKERLGLNFYQKTQIYKVDWEIKIKNLASEQKTGHLILPIPSDQPGQSLLEGPTYSETAKKIGLDRKFENSYGVWQLNLLAGEEKNITENFVIKISPQVNKNFQQFSIEEYKNDTINTSSLASDDYINLSDENIKKIAQELGADKNLGIVLNKINNYIIKKLKYGKAIPGLYTYKEALENDLVDCGGFSTLFASLTRAFGIPTRLVVGFWAGYPQNDMHAWVEIQLPDGEWLPADPSIEKLRREKRTKKFGRLGAVGSDRIIFSYGSDIPVTINDQEHKIDILQNPYIFETEIRPFLSITARLITERL
ncbi:MAG: transglutaminase-like domain-containing protein [Candidatus Uhrbacteria bacterium]